VILSPLPISFVLVRSSNPNGLLVYCVIGICAGIFLFIQGFRLLQRRHLILNTPFSKIRSASIGMVELSGLAAGPYTMVAPVTVRPCYYYRTVVWEWKQSGKNKQWVKAASECMHVPFFLDDNTGKVMVDPRGADLDLHCDFKEEFCDSFFTTKEEVPGNVRSFLSRHGVSTSNKIKVEEFCIKPKNSLFLLGTLDENPGLEVSAQPIQDAEPLTAGPTGSFSFSLSGAAMSMAAAGNSFASEFLSGRSAESDAFGEGNVGTATTTVPRQVIHLSPAPAPATAAEMTQQQKVAAALLKAGIASPAAWAAAGVRPFQTGVRMESNDSPQGSVTSGNGAGAELDGFDPHPPVVMMKGKNNPTFLISWRSQRDVARSLAWKCTLMIWGGPALALLSLYVLLSIKNLF
jgi:hypothetical protein